MSTNPTPLFSALQGSGYPTDIKRIQEVTIYCASRFRAAIIATVNTPQDSTARVWLQRCLLTELQFGLSYIGMAAAIGQSVDIPIMIRALACDFYSHAPQSLPVTFDREFLLALDGGSDPDDMSAVASSYHLQWWTSNAVPADQDLLSLDTIDDCLSYHRNVTGIKGFLPTQLRKTAYTWSRDLSFNPEGQKLQCNQCRLYRGVTMGVLDDLQDLRNHVHGLEVCYEGRSDVTTRRATGFYQLYKAAVAKEYSAAAASTSLPIGQSLAAPTPDEPSVPVTKGKGKAKNTKKTTKRLTKEVRDNAAAELTRMENMPHLKWTWGSTLTAQEVVQLQQPRPEVAPDLHSGYQDSLPWGPCGKGSVVSSSPPPGPHKFSDLAEDTHDIPELDIDQYPVHFTHPPLRHFYGDPPKTLVTIEGEPSGYFHAVPPYVIPIPPRGLIASPPAGYDSTLAHHTPADIDPATIFSSRGSPTLSPSRGSPFTYGIGSARDAFSDLGSLLSDPEIDPAAIFSSRGSTPPSPSHGSPLNNLIGGADDAYSNLTSSSDADLNPATIFSSRGSTPPSPYPGSPFNNPIGGADDAYSDLTSSSDADLDPAAIFSSRGSTPLTIPAVTYNIGRAHDAYSDMSASSDEEVDPTAIFSSRGSTPAAATTTHAINTPARHSSPHPLITTSLVPGQSAVPPGPYTSVSFGPIPRAWIDPSHSDYQDLSDED